MQVKKQITRIEILAGMRPTEEADTRALLSTLVWHSVDAEIAKEAGTPGRRWLPNHHTSDSADRAIAATAIRTEARLLTLNVRHFPMLTDLQAPCSTRAMSASRHSRVHPRRPGHTTTQSGHGASRDA